MALSDSQNMPSAQLAFPIVPKAISRPPFENCVNDRSSSISRYRREVYPRPTRRGICEPVGDTSADELNVSPAELNVRIPQWTQKLVEQIFASHLEDWPALLKSLRSVGDDVRKTSRAGIAAEQKAALQEAPNR